MGRRAAALPRKLPRQRRSRETFDALLTAAAQVLVRDGYARANVNEIARRAGCSIGSLYQYFPSKEALVSAVMRWHTRRMIEVFFRGFDGLSALSPEGAIRALVDRTFDALAVDPRLQKVIVEQVPRSGLLLLTRKFKADLVRVVRDYLGAHRAEVAVDDLELAAAIIVQTVGAVALSSVVDDPRLGDRSRIAAELTSLVVGYIRGA